MEAADIKPNRWLAPSPPLPVDDDVPASGAVDSHAIRAPLEGLVARIGAVAHRHGHQDVLDLIGTVPDPDHPEEPVNSLC
jgi:hypothetical protein